MLFQEHTFSVYVYSLAIGCMNHINVAEVFSDNDRGGSAMHFQSFTSENI